LSPVLGGILDYQFRKKTWRLETEPLNDRVTLALDDRVFSPESRLSPQPSKLVAGPVVSDDRLPFAQGS
jgi:hypothetical protein